MRTWYGILLGLCCTLVLATVASAQETGTAARLGMGARPLALGGAFVSVAEDASAVFWNPAGLAYLQRTQVQLHYRRLTSSYSMDSANVGFGPARHGLVWGAALSVLHRAGVPAEDVLNGFEGEPGANEFSGQMVVAFRPHETLALGIGVGPIISSLNSQSSRSVGWGGNAGLMWSTGNTAVGFAVLGATAGLGTSTTPQTYRYRLSTGISHRLGNRLLLATQLDRDRGGDPSVALGTEWNVIPALALRAGMHQPVSEVSSTQIFSNGLGYQQGNFQMDYAVRYAQESSPEHLLTLRFRLGSAPATGMRQDDAPQLEPVATTTSLEDAAPPVEDASSAALASPVTPQPRPASQPLTVQPPVVTPARTSNAVVPVVPKEVSRTLPVGLKDEGYSRLPQQGNGPAAGAQGKGLSMPTSTPVTPAPSRIFRPSEPVPRRPLPVPTQKPVVQPVQYVVRAGVHEDLDSAALEIARFYRAHIRPDLERRGGLFIVVVKRCSSRAEAKEWVARAAEADLRCIIDEE